MLLAVVFVAGCTDTEGTGEAATSSSTSVTVGVIEITEIPTSIPTDFDLPVYVPENLEHAAAPSEPPSDDCTVAFEVPTTELAFAHDSFIITEGAAAEIRAFVQNTIDGNPGRPLLRVDALGYASIEGSVEHNAELSALRASAVTSIIADVSSAAGAPMVPVGMGETAQFAPGEDPASLALNRKVVVSLHLAGCPLAPLPPHA